MMTEAEIDFLKCKAQIDFTYAAIAGSAFLYDLALSAVIGKHAILSLAATVAAGVAAKFALDGISHQSLATCHEKRNEEFRQHGITEADVTHPAYSIIA